MRKMTAKNVRATIKYLRKYGTPMEKIKHFFITFDPEDRSIWISGFVKKDNSVVITGKSK